MRCQISAIIVAMLLTTGPGLGLSLSDGAQPAEFPPADYVGDTYVDSRGCVYIRAGFGGEVKWVPRVTSDRKVVCGAEPSLAGPVAPVAPIPAPQTPVAPAAAPVQEIVSAPAPVPAPTPAPAPKPTPRRAVAAAPAPAPVPRATQVPGIETVRVTCPAVVRRGQKILYRGMRLPLRCKTGQTRTIQYDVSLSNGSRIRVVAAPAGTVSHTAALGQTVVPPGYRAAWEDDRLNPSRGEPGGLGQAQTNTVWTETVPRRLVSQEPIETPRRQPSTRRDRDTVALAETSSPPPAAAQTSRVVVSSSSAAAAASHRFVQVGSFGVAANAQNTAARLTQNGLPARISKVTRGGKVLQIVMAGPFTSQAQLNAALRKVRNLGFSDAFARK